MVGVIDEIRMPATDIERNLTLVETKTRSQAALPSEPQGRNGRCAYSHDLCLGAVSIFLCNHG